MLRKSDISISIDVGWCFALIGSHCGDILKKLDLVQEVPRRTVPCTK